MQSTHIYVVGINVIWRWIIFNRLQNHPGVVICKNQVVMVPFWSVILKQNIMENPLENQNQLAQEPYNLQPLNVSVYTELQRVIFSEVSNYFKNIH